MIAVVLSSSLFWVVYGALCFVWFLAQPLWPHAKRESALPDARVRLDAYAIALLTGRPRHVVATAVTVLRAHGLLTDGVAPGILAVVEDAGTPIDPLERAVCEAVRRAGQLPADALERESAVCDAIERIRLELTRAGLLVDRRTLVWKHGLWLGIGAELIGLGTVWMVLTWDHDPHVGIMVLAVLGIAAMMVLHIIVAVTERERAVPSALGAAALKEWRERDPAASRTADERIAVSTAIAGEYELPVIATTGETSPARVADGERMLLAEEILLLGGAGGEDGCPPIEAGTVLAGALLVELAALGRLAIAIPPDENEAFVSVLDGQLTNDALLDDALALVANPGSVAVTTDAFVGWRLLGSVARWRLRARGRVSKRYLVLWWRDAWTCAELPRLESTLLRQVLTL